MKEVLDLAKPYPQDHKLLQTTILVHAEAVDLSKKIATQRCSLDVQQEGIEPTSPASAQWEFDADFKLPLRSFASRAEEGRC